MDLLQWFLFFLAIQVIHFAGTWRLYEKAGRKRWEALVPVYNAVVLMRIVHRSPWWALLLFVPIVNLIMFPVVWVQILKAFGKTSTTDYLLGIVTLGFYIFAINYNDKTEYNGEIENKESTVSSLLFAIVVATLVHTYVMQPFTIPTGSLEKTLLIGDFLFVSKFHYGARTPMTTVAAPMVHDTLPLMKSKSYSNWPQLPYFRFPGIEKVKKNDIVVFNWPVDTVRFFGDRQTVGLRKPIDKKSNYVKRCVGTPGDSLSIKNGFVYINGKELQLSDRAKVQYYHDVQATGDLDDNILRRYGIKERWRFYNVPVKIWENPALWNYLNSQKYFLREKTRDSVNVQAWGYVPYDELQTFGMTPIMNRVAANITLETAAKLKGDTFLTTIEKIVYRPTGATDVFPHNKPNWTGDNLGSIYIPEKGKTVQLTAETLPFYKMVIVEYEKNTLEVKGSEIKINGKPATSYTFKQNYYYMMGDNRHNSEDSRFWGFVPEDHIVGKPVFVWMSLDQDEKWGNIGKKIRWDRMFTTVGGSGEPVSYFKYFLIALAGWFAFDFFRKKKRKVAEEKN